MIGLPSLVEHSESIKKDIEERRSLVKDSEDVRGSVQITDRLTWHEEDSWSQVSPEQGLKERKLKERESTAEEQVQQ